MMLLMVVVVVIVVIIGCKIAGVGKVSVPQPNFGVGLNSQPCLGFIKIIIDIWTLATCSQSP